MINIPEACFAALKPIAHFSKYKICPCHGTIVSCVRSEPKIMKTEVDKDGYLRLELQMNGTSFRVRVHRLVLETFGGPPTEERKETRHLDGNKLNNCIENLCWGTGKENAEDRALHGSTQSGENHHKAKLTKEDVLVIVDRIKTGDSYAQIARDYGMSEFPIACIGKGKSWTSITGGPLKKPQKSPKGEKHGMSKLSKGDIVKIRNLLKSGMEQKHIAEKFSISQSMVSMINTEKNWVMRTVKK